MVLDGTGVKWIKDNTLEGIVRGALNLGKEDPLTKSAMERLFFLDATSLKIKDLIGLEYATQLEGLFLDNNQISDIIPLKGLTQLEGLSLAANQISDITPLKRTYTIKAVISWRESD